MTGIRKIRLLALHGKGTSASIMHAQIKSLIKAMEGEVHVEYLQGGVASKPYQGIESLFPKQEYAAWYSNPTAGEVALAHERIRQCLTHGTIVPSLSKGFAAAATQCFQPMNALITPPDTPNSPCGTSSYTMASLSAYGSAALLPMTGFETPEMAPGDPCSFPIQPPFDGVICFSQGCAALTGLLLTLTDNLPIKFVILICGGRPFNGLFSRIEAKPLDRIRLPSVHVHGKLDPGLAESQRLSSLYCDQDKVILELDIGHCPPRRTADIDKVAAAVGDIVTKYC